MGCGHSVSEEAIRSKEISRQLKRDFSRYLCVGHNNGPQIKFEGTIVYQFAEMPK